MIPPVPQPDQVPARPTFIDLFSGCGGFTLGMLRAGFECRATIDHNPEAVATLRSNLQAKSPTHLPPVGVALEADLTTLEPATLATLIGSDTVDVIVGGPPCQGFSTARQRDGSNHGTERLKDDPRRHLFRNFLDHVEHFQPKVFIIENVLGLRAADGGRYFTAVQHEARILGRNQGRPGYRVHPQIERGEQLGSPQKRRRQLIVGVRADLPGYFNPELRASARAVIGATLGDAILDLPNLHAGEGENQSDYNLRRRTRDFLGGVRDNFRRAYLERVAEIGHEPRLFNHVARPHNARDLRDFALIPEGSSSAVCLREGVQFEFPYDQSSFKDRYTRQHRNRPCSTIVAHLAKDGLMFIHPRQQRSLTPREAARVQTFPDWFVFPEARTHSFRLIGNAVPPLVAEAAGDGILRYLGEIEQPARPQGPAAAAEPGPEIQLPADQHEAARWLAPFTDPRTDRRALRAMPTAEFLRAWQALLWLFPDLHPDNAVEHGTERHDDPTHTANLAHLGCERYTRSGWPVMLEGFGREAWRRFGADEFSDDAFYCVPAQRAGLAARFQHAEEINRIHAMVAPDGLPATAAHR